MDRRAPARRSEALDRRDAGGRTRAGGVAGAAALTSQSDRTGSDVGAIAARLVRRRRAGLPVRHRQSWPLRAVATDLLGADRGCRRADRGFAGGGDRDRLRPDRGQFRWLGRSAHLAPDRCLDGVSAGVAVDRAGGGDRRGADLGDHSHRCRRLDPLCARGPGRNSGAAAARLCRRRARHRIEPRSNPAPGDSAQSRAAGGHPAVGRDGHRDPGGSHPVFCRHFGDRRHPDLGRHDRRGTPDRLSGAMDHGAADRLHHIKRDRVQSARRRPAFGARSGAATMTAALSVQGLQVAIGTGASSANVLRGVSLDLQRGEVRGLVGESGAGKSMLGRAVLGLLPANAVIAAGTIQFEGRDLVAMPEPQRRSLLGRRIALIPQDPMTSLNPVRRVGAQIAILLRHHLALSKRGALERAAELLAEVAIREPRRVLELYPHEISGGMRQRVLIAMAFACDPSLVIADEPTTALDVTVQRQVLQLVERLRQRHGAAVLFITHDLGVVAKICRTMTVLHAGRVLEEGETAEVLAKPRHPYTRALLAATPRADRPAETLRPVPPALIENLWSEAYRLDRLVVAGPA